jgi:hypothetical protein
MEAKNATARAAAQRPTRLNRLDVVMGSIRPTKLLRDAPVWTVNLKSGCCRRVHWSSLGISCIIYSCRFVLPL